MFENLRLRINGPRAADDDAQIVSAKPRRSRSRRKRAGPGPSLTRSRSIVRAPDMTASAVARSSSRCCRSRGPPNGSKWRLAGAILPSAVIATLIRTKGRAGFFFILAKAVQPRINTDGHGLKMALPHPNPLPKERALATLIRVHQCPSVVCLPSSVVFRLSVMAARQ